MTVAVHRGSVAALAGLLLAACGPPAAPAQPPSSQVVVNLGPQRTRIEQRVVDTVASNELGPSADRCVDRFRDAQDLTRVSNEAAELYRNGHAAERSQELITASNAYSLLIERHPNSAFAPLAYLGMANMLEQAGQPALAANNLDQLLITLKASHSFHRYARYRRGTLELRRGDYTAAMGYLREAIIGTPAASDDLCAPEIVDAARSGYITSYVVAGRPELALDSMRPLSGDLGDGHAHTVDYLVELAQAYLTDKQPSQATIVLVDLLQRYQPLRQQCSTISKLVDQQYDTEQPTIAALATLEAHAYDRCGR